MNRRTSRAWRIIVPITLAALIGSAPVLAGEKPAFPQLDLPGQASGQRAIDLLGDKLPEVARWHGKTPQEFASILRRDRSARLDRHGRLHYVEAVIVAGAGTASGSTTLASASYPLEQTFALHSRPGAQRTIYLDFDGYNATNTAWNDSYGMSNISSPPFDLDGVPYSFSQTELERIQAIWQRVAEDYAPFDVDVTTEEPPADAITRSGSGDAIFGTRVVITRDFVPGGCGCGGFAYVGVFDMVGDYYKPAYVFFDRLGAGNEKYVAEAIAHEAGHNAGLNHDGSATTAYYAGQGSGATGWAPIMGVGYYQPLVQWSKGEYAGANNQEDDIAVMQANQLPLRADDHGDTLALASPLSGGTTLSGSGLIERRTDRDVFKFSAGSGNASFSLAFANPSPNLDAQLDLLDSAGTVIASANPADALGATISTVLPAAGTYYLRVDGVGKGSASTDGYSDYASLGAYELAGTVPAAANQPPVAVAAATPTSGTAPLAVSFSSSGSYDPEGNLVSQVWNFGDGSAPVSASSAQHTYAAGTYTATLTVTDGAGLSDVSTVSINANPPVAVPSMRIDDITISIKGGKRGATATAAVTVRDGDGNPVAGASLSGTWSGVVSGSASGVTGSNGTANIRSPKSSGSGTFTFTVTGAALSGYVYTPADNVETSDSASN